jgi:hypothetical protein
MNIVLHKCKYICRKCASKNTSNSNYNAVYDLVSHFTVTTIIIAAMTVHIKSEIKAHSGIPST